MAFKQFSLDEETLVTVYKRKASRSLRLSIAPGGEIRVSIPTWTPYAAGVAFARSRLQWIKEQRLTKQQLRQGQLIGKAHHLQFSQEPSRTTVATRVQSTQVVVSYPLEMPISHSEVQRAAELASIRALRKQARQLLPQRLAQLAAKHDFTYQSVRIKQLKSRWGSCDHQTNIVLSLFLMQLPWECIDYVLLHELTHTKILHHGPKFWSAMSMVVPDLPRIRKEMRTYQPLLNNSRAE
ncbi:MAG: SprT family zinc-dependent metalloprotease [Candidatus Saccharimonadales bacterium]